MGTRADFYIGRGDAAEWLGSIAWDGYHIHSGWGVQVVGLTGEATYRAAVESILSESQDSTRPDQGWPWPWDDSGTTDYAYAFDEGKVWASCFGDAWYEPTAEEPEESEGAVFPNMASRRNLVSEGPRSGLITVKQYGDGRTEVV